MLGVLINAAAVLTGGAIGLIIGEKIPARVRETVMQGLALSVVLVGFLPALKTQDVLCVIVCIVLGALFGEWIDIERRLTRLGERLERLAPKGGGERPLVPGFVTASLIFCVGAMAVVGSMESGLAGNHSTLIAKSMLDGVGSVFFAAALGPGVLLSAAAIFVYQGAIALFAGSVAPVLTEPIVREMSAIGGLIIACIGLNMLEAVRVRVGNLLPGIFLPILYLPAYAFVSALFG